MLLRGLHAPKSSLFTYKFLEKHAKTYLFSVQVLVMYRSSHYQFIPYSYTKVRRLEYVRKTWTIGPGIRC